MMRDTKMLRVGNKNSTRESAAQRCSLSNPAMKRVDTSGSRCLSSRGAPAEEHTWHITDQSRKKGCCFLSSIHVEFNPESGTYVQVHHVRAFQHILTSLGVLDVQEVGSNAGLCGALPAHAVHQLLHDAVKALRHCGAIPHILRALLAMSTILAVEKT